VQSELVITTWFTSCTSYNFIACFLVSCTAYGRTSTIRQWLISSYGHQRVFVTHYSFLKWFQCIFLFTWVFCDRGDLVLILLLKCHIFVSPSISASKFESPGSTFINKLTKTHFNIFFWVIHHFICFNGIRTIASINFLFLISTRIITWLIYQVCPIFKINHFLSSLLQFLCCIEQSSQ